MITLIEKALAALVAGLKQLPVIRASEIDGEESDGTPRHWRDRPYVSLRKVERLLDENMQSLVDQCRADIAAFAGAVAALPDGEMPSAWDAHAMRQAPALYVQIGRAVHPGQAEAAIHVALLDAMRFATAMPIDMVLHCPACGKQHIDAPEGRVLYADEPISEQSYTPLWSNPPHRSHLCHGCGHIWRPADVPTNGVAAVKTAGRADSPPAARLAVVPMTEAQAIDLWHRSPAAHSRQSAFEWFAAGALAAERHHGIVTREGS